MQMRASSQTMLRKRPTGKSEATGEMTALDHLRELRKRLLVCLGALLLFLLAGMRYVPDCMQLLLELGAQYQYQFVYISPEELLLEYLTIDLVAAMFLTLPVLLYEIWRFLRPGLKQRERRLVLAAIGFGAVFALLGILFAYRILIPFSLRFLISLGENSGIRPFISVKNYISFILTLLLLFALLFELPVVAILLTRFGILKTAAMKRFRKVVIPLVFLIAAVITPPDVISQVMVAIPLLLLYEFSILLCTWLERFRGHSAR